MEPKDHPILIALSKADRKDLEKLAAAWRTTLAEAVRRAVRETLERLK
jgi:hypothetical protein